MNARRTIHALLLTAGALLLAGGCGDGDGQTVTELTGGQRAAFNASYAMLDAMVSAFSTVYEAEDLDFEALQNGQTVTGGECPAFVADQVNNVLNAQFEWTGNCDSLALGSISGTMLLNLDLGTRTGTATFNGLTVDGQAIDGTVQLSFAPGDPVNFNQVTAVLDLTFTGAGSIAGTLTVNRNPDDSVTLNAAGLTFVSTATGQTYGVSITNLVIDPAGNGNLVPESGSITLVVPNDGLGPATVTLVATFGAATPTTGQFQVSANGLPPQTITLAGF